jgi:hypothetical protein
MSRYGSDYDYSNYSDYMHATDYYNCGLHNFPLDQDFNPTKSQLDNMLSDISKAMLDCQNRWRDFSAQSKLLRVPKRSVNRTKVKVSNKKSKPPASVPVVIAPISVSLATTSISSLPPSSEISVTLKIDCSAILSPPTDDEFLHVTPGNLDLVTCLEQSPIINSLSSVDAESKVEGAILDLVVAVSACKKENAPSDPMHDPRSVEYSSLFSIIPTTQIFMDLFHSGTLHQFELGRDPPVVLDIADSKSGFGLVQKFKDLFHTCTLDQFELGRDPPNVLDIGDSRFGFG